MTTIICTTPKREMWLTDCLRSLGDRSVMILSDYSYEVGKLKFIVENTKIERFLFLQDSIVFKDADKFYEQLSKYQGSVSVNRCPKFYGSFMGVYERRILEQLKIPVANSKRDIVTFEMTFNDSYVRLLGGTVPVMYPELHDGNNTGFVERHGRTNMVLENDVMTKYKGTWKWEWDSPPVWNDHRLIKV